MRFRIRGSAYLLDGCHGEGFFLEWLTHSAMSSRRAAAQMWNTGCNNIFNGLDEGISILDFEDQRLAISVPAKGSANWKGVIFPWCSNATEVRKKAFRVSSMQSGRMFLYLFQDYNTSRVCWSLASADPWSSRQVVRADLQGDKTQTRFPDLDLYVVAPYVIGFPSDDENDQFSQWEPKVLEAIGAVISIVGVISAAL